MRLVEPLWYRDWTGEQCVIVGSGPTAAAMPLELGRGRAKFIAINDSWQLVPWADMLYACDARWWRAYEGVPEFQGLKITQDQQLTEAKQWGVEWVRCDRRKDVLLTKPPGIIGWGGNGGFQAINLLVQFKVKKIILVGFDMRLDKGIHWNGPHKGRHEPLNDPTDGNVARWCRAVDGIAPQLRSLGVLVINCSRVSALKQYPKMTFEEALDVSPNVRAPDVHRPGRKVSGA